ncbi:DUF2130 domain-containing protein [Leptospira borgpetersenii]|nr:DUF2130 domain-containing protein [Leptospira borgpetersenii]ALO27435.1 hypothetical protein LBBP_03235 [Leptospira borgpetersenii serovar Ballum]ANH01771.1 PF09903 domain protein [Leptospira borgpetersenii str. 4E]
MSEFRFHTLHFTFSDLSTGKFWDKLLVGLEFRQRIESMGDTFKEMKNDLDSEKITMEKIWSKREKQMHRIIQNTAGMYGDLTGLGATYLL